VPTVDKVSLLFEMQTNLDMRMLIYMQDFLLIQSVTSLCKGSKYVEKMEQVRANIHLDVNEKFLIVAYLKTLSTGTM